MKRESHDGIGIGEILLLSSDRGNIYDTQIIEIKNKLDSPQKYTWDHTLVDYGTYPAPNPVVQCKEDLTEVFNYINKLSEQPIPNLTFPYDTSMGTMGELENKLLIHCWAGMGRTGTVLIGVICLKECVLFEDGFHKLKEYSRSLRLDTSIQCQAIKEMFSSY